MEFERRARDAGCDDQAAKVLLLKSLNSDVIRTLDAYMLSKDIATDDISMEDRVTHMNYRTMLQYLKQGHLAEFTRGMESGATRPKANAATVSEVAPAPAPAPEAPEVKETQGAFAVAGVFAATPASRPRSSKPKSRSSEASSTGATAGSSYTPVKVPAIDK